jgi:hypothetical protein
MKFNTYIRTETILIAIFFITSVVFAGPIPDTGQNQSYTDINGEDSDYLINPQTLTKLDHSGNALSALAETWSMVRDEVTGLIWEIKKIDGTIQDKSKMYSWYDPNDLTNGGYAGTNANGTDVNDYIRTLNSQIYGGFSDWRLPDINELATLLNMNQDDGIQVKFFPNTMQGGYWTSTTYAGNSQKAWYISFVTGKNAYDDKSRSLYVRAVRGAASGAEFSRFVINTNGTISDTHTGLMWQKDDFQNPLTWEEAITQFNDLVLANHTDWRMPTREELRSIVDYSRITPSIFVNEFPNTVLGNYWTSTAHPFQENHVWCIHFYNGNDNYQSKNNAYFSRAVRGGQDQSDENKILILSPAQGSIWEKEKSMSITWEHRNLDGNVEIAISRDGGAFELIEGGNTINDGQFTWDYITGQASVSCMMRISPDNSPEKANIQSFFSIISSKIPVLEVSPTTKNVPPLLGTTQISIINNGTEIMDWQAIVQDTWLHIQSDSTGTNNYTLEIQYDNNAGDVRTGHVVITAPGALYSPQTIAITQEAGYPVIHMAPTSQTISAIDDTVLFTITNEGTKFMTWTATIQDNWLSFMGNSSGTDTGQIVMRVEPNYGQTRTGTVYITAPGAINSPTAVTVTQTAGFPILKVIPESQEVSAESNTIDLQVFNAGAGNMAWTAESKTDWLIIDTGFSGVNEGKIRLRYQANDSLARTGTIQVSTDDGQLLNITINQKPGQPVLMVSPEEHHVSGNEGIVSYTITNAGSGILTWSAVSNADWMTIMNQSTGIQEGIIRVKYAQNTSTPRIGLITVSSTALAQTQTRVSVYQDALEGFRPPDWDYNPKNYQYQCMLVASVYNNKKQQMVNDNDVLAAFINGECRGLANPQDSPFGKLYFLQIWSNTTNDPVTFQFFDSESGTIFSQLNEKIVFSVNASFGSMYAPYEINITEVDFNLSLKKGWNWVSMNVRAKDMRLDNLLESINGQCQFVVGQEGFAEYYGEKWFGTIEEIDPAQMYLMKMYNVQTLIYSGDPVFYENTTIQLDNGWNWIGYLPFFEMDINVALKSLGSAADRIVGQDGFSEYSDGWWGGLTVLTPCQGYQIQVSEPSELVYPRLDSTENTGKRKAQKKMIEHPSSQFARFQYPSCMTVQLKHKNHILTPNSEDRLFALSKSGEIRGSAKPIQVLDKSLFFLQIWMQSQTESIEFKYKPALNRLSLNSSERLQLKAYDVQGSIEAPLTLTVEQDYLESLIEILQILAGGH